MSRRRTPAKQKAHELATYLRDEHPDSGYLQEVFRYVRAELQITMPRPPQRLPDVPSDDEIRRFYDAVWQTRNMQDLVLIKTLLYTGIRVSELTGLQLTDVDLTRCQLRIHRGKGGKDRVVPFPNGFMELFALHVQGMERKHATYLFESRLKRRYTERGIRKLLDRYAKQAGLKRSLSPHQFRHFLLTWLKKQGIDDAFIQPYSGHASRQSLEVYSRLAIGEAQHEYDEVIGRFPV